VEKMRWSITTTVRVQGTAWLALATRTGVQVATVDEALRRGSMVAASSVRTAMVAAAVVSAAALAATPAQGGGRA